MKKKDELVPDYESLFRLYRKGSEVVNAIQHTGKETVEALRWLDRSTGIDMVEVEPYSGYYCLYYGDNRCFIGDYIVFSYSDCYIVDREEFEKEYDLLAAYIPKEGIESLEGSKTFAEPIADKERELWDFLVRELGVLDDNDFTATQIFSYVNKHFSK